MKKSHPALWGFGLAGLTAGLLLTGVDMFRVGDIAGLAGGYGLLMVGAAVYLLGGLAIRERLGRRTTVVAATTAKASKPSSAPAISARS